MDQFGKSISACWVLLFFPYYKSIIQIYYGAIIELFVMENWIFFFRFISGSLTDGGSENWASCFTKFSKLKLTYSTVFYEFNVKIPPLLFEKTLITSQSIQNKIPSTYSKYHFQPKSIKFQIKIFLKFFLFPTRCLKIFKMPKTINIREEHFWIFFTETENSSAIPVLLKRLWIAAFNWHYIWKRASSKIDL